MTKWCKERVVEEISVIFNTGEPVLNSNYGSSNLYKMAMKFFGTWKNAIEYAGFIYEDRRISKNWTKENTIEEIKRLHKEGHSLAITDIDVPSIYTMACRHFGSWKKAIESAGLNYQEIKLLKEWTPEIVIEKIKEMNKKDLSYTEMRKNNKYMMDYATKQFGSWQQAITDAGLNYEEIKRNGDWSEEKILNLIKEMFNNNEELSLQYIRRTNGPLYHMAKKHYGSWRKAIELCDIKYEKIMAEGWGQPCKDQNNNLCDSIIEREISDYLIDCEKENKLKVYNKVRVSQDRKWTCDFVIEINNKKIWIEYDGLINKRPTPYGQNHPKILHYINNNFNYKIITNINELKDIINGGINE